MVTAMSKPWLETDAWPAVVRSNARLGLRATWGFAAVWLLIASAKALRDQYPTVSLRVQTEVLDDVAAVVLWFLERPSLSGRFARARA